MKSAVSAASSPDIDAIRTGDARAWADIFKAHGPGLETHPVRAVKHLHAPSPGPPPGSGLPGESGGAVVAVVQDLHLQSLVGVVQLSNGVDGTADHKRLVEQGQLHRDDRSPGGIPPITRQRQRAPPPNREPPPVAPKDQEHGKGTEIGHAQNRGHSAVLQAVREAQGDRVGCAHRYRRIDPGVGPFKRDGLAQPQGAAQGGLVKGLRPAVVP